MDQMPSTSGSRPEHHRNGSDALHFKEETWTPQKWIRCPVFRSPPWSGGHLIHFCGVQVYSLKWRASDPFPWCSDLLLEVEGIWSISVVFRSTLWPTSSLPSWFNTLRFLWISALVCRLEFDDLAPIMLMILYIVCIWRRQF
jgi:hypothetical protein